MNKRYRNDMSADVRGIKLISKFKPPLHAGETFTVEVQQTAAGAVIADDDRKVHFVAHGPHERLSEIEIIGRYPAPGASTSDAFLPHIVLSRRSLPWERLRDKGDPDAPWLALLLFKKSEVNPPISTKVETLAGPASATFYQRLKTAGYTDDTQLDIMYVPDDTLRRVLPLPSELALLCHAQQLVTPTDLSDAPSDASLAWNLDGDGSVAVVISNRLPDASGPGDPEEHMACLVSLEGRDDLPWPQPGQRRVHAAPAMHVARAAPIEPSDERAHAASSVGLQMKLSPLVVLHSWRFMPSKLRDFEQVIKAIRYAPNGGVLRICQRPVSLDHASVTTITQDGYLRVGERGAYAGARLYRSPLTPDELGRHSGKGIAVAPSPRMDPDRRGLDDSYTVAFEIGHLLTLANDGALADLQHVRSTISKCAIRRFLDVDPRPVPFARRDWTVDPAGVPQPEGVQQLPSRAARADFAGIAEYYGQSDAHQLLLELGASPAGAPLEHDLDINNVPVGELDARFAQLVTHCESGRKP